MGTESEHTVKPEEADAEAEQLLDQLSRAPASHPSRGQHLAPRAFTDLATGGRSVSRIMKSVEHIAKDADKLRTLALLNNNAKKGGLTIRANDSLNVQLAKALAAEYHQKDTTVRERLAILKELRGLYEVCRAGSLDSAKALISAAKAAADVSKKITENDRLQGQTSSTNLVKELRSAGLSSAEIAAVLGLPLANVEYTLKKLDEKAAAGADEAEAEIHDAPQPQPQPPLPDNDLTKAHGDTNRNTFEYGE